MLLENFQIIKENGEDRFAVIDYSEFKQVKELISSSEKLQDYLDYIHIKELKKKNEKKYSLKDAKKELGL